MNEPLYTIEILRLAASIPHLGELENPQGRAEVRSPTCGSRVAVEVALDEAGRVAALGQRVEACAFGQASAALMGAHAIGRQAAEVEQALTDFEWPGLKALAPARSRRARHGAMLLPLRGLSGAIHNAQGKGR